MKKSEVNGICTYCFEEIKKNSKSILSHLGDCPALNKSKSSIKSDSLIILLEGEYSPEYWLVIKANPDVKFQILDKFIRDIWVECCGHLSEFRTSGRKIQSKAKLIDVFGNTPSINYIYDFGTPTEIALSFLDNAQLANNKEIEILIRNKKPDITCINCDNKAVAICPMYETDECGPLCQNCLEDHECVIEEGEEILIDITNSPRLGECNYNGYDVNDVKKYFPNEIVG